MESVEAPQPSRCVVHVLKSSENLLPISNERWETICKSATARRQTKMFDQSKYRPVVDALPPKPTQTDGYHRRCYRSFTAIQENSLIKEDLNCNKTMDLRSPAASTSGLSTSKSRVGIFENKCLYCDKQWKTRKDGSKEGLGAVQTKDAEEKILMAANLLQENDISARISGIDMIAKEVKFHHSCRSKRLAAAARATTNAPKQKCDSTALKRIFEYVRSKVIIENRPERLTSVYDRYCFYAEEEDEVDRIICNCQYLGNILKKHLADVVCISSPDAKKGLHHLQQST